MDFNTANKTFREVMGNGLRYLVPKFQRDYAWNQDQWLDLWEDALEATRPDGDRHYMGYLVLQRAQDGKEHSVIDGQQRLATLSLLVFAVMFELQDLADKESEAIGTNKNRARLFQNTYVEVTDAVSLRPRRKLELNRNNDAYFHTIGRIKVPPIRRIRSTERLLWQACTFFRERVREEFTDGAAMGGFVDQLADQLFFTTINVSNDLDAYRVFETLNARGVKLSTPDLLKNFIFSRIDHDALHPSQLDELDMEWGEIGQQLGRIDFPTFVLAEWNRRHTPVRETGLFREIRGSISDADSASTYLNQLRSSSETYAALHDPDDEFWKNSSIHTEAGDNRYLGALKMFNLRQPYGLLMTVWEEGDTKAFKKVLRWVYAFSMRYHAIDGSPHQPLIRTYSDASRAFLKNQNLSAIKEAFRPLYPKDPAFTENFLRHTVATTQTPRKARFLLARLEEQANGNERVRDEDLTLEHILPQTPDGAWRSRFGDHVEEDVDRLGNMALLTRGQNAQLGRADYATKKAALAATGLHVNELDAEAWDHEAVERRQRRLAELAVQAWRIDFD